MGFKTSCVEKMKTHNNGMKIKRFLELKCFKIIALSGKKGSFVLFLEVELTVKWILLKTFVIFK